MEDGWITGREGKKRRRREKETERQRREWEREGGRMNEWKDR